MCSKKARQKSGFSGRGGRIRTYDLHIPNVARYQATLHPDYSIIYFFSGAIPVPPWRDTPSVIRSNNVARKYVFADLIPRIFNHSKKKIAEREGFEPSIRLTSYVGLANRWFQPLTHLSGPPKFLGVAKVCIKPITTKLYFKKY